jgi:hypothetical protein
MTPPSPLSIFIDASFTPFRHFDYFSPPDVYAAIIDIFIIAIFCFLSSLLPLLAPFHFLR